MTEDPLGQISELTPAEARAHLISLAQERGAEALETLRAALEVPALAPAALDALGEMPAQEAWDLLERVAREGIPRQLRKAARRAQHRLRSRGFHPAVAVRETTPPTVEQAQVSFFDAAGTQFLRVVGPAPLGMARYASFIVSTEGLHDCAYLLAGRADLDDLLAREDKHFGENLVEMDLAYVARRVRRAVTRSREQRRSLPEDYFEATRLLEDAPEDTTPEDLAAIEPAGEPVSPREAHNLFKHQSMWSWLLHPEDLSSYVEDWLHMLEHQPIRTEEGLANLGAVQARGRIAARIIDDLIDEAVHARLVEQLHEQSRLLFALGENDLAKVAARSALGLGQSPAADDPFLRTLVNESMDLAVQITHEIMEEEKDPWMSVSGEAGSLWVPRPARTASEEEEGDEEEPTPRLWLPGQ